MTVIALLGRLTKQTDADGCCCLAGPAATGRAAANGKARTGPGGRAQLPDELLPIAEVIPNSTHLYARVTEKCMSATIPT